MFTNSLNNLSMSSDKSEDEQQVISKQIVDYYRKYSQNKQLPKYFSGSSLSYMPPIVKEAEFVPKSQPLIIIEDVGSDVATEPQPEPKIESPTSSITSNKKLEWDNGADIGYNNASKKSNLYKSASLPIILPQDTKIKKEKTKLSSQVVTVISYSSGDNASEKDYQSSSSSPSLPKKPPVETSSSSSYKTNKLVTSSSSSTFSNTINYLKAKIGSPDAESTPKINVPYSQTPIIAKKRIVNKVINLCLTKPIVVHCLDQKKKGFDKNVQTSFSEKVSRSIQTNDDFCESNESPVCAPIENQSIIFVNYDSESDKRTCSSNTQTGELIASQCDSFEYYKDHPKSASSNSSKDIPLLGQLISEKQSNSLKIDIDKSLVILHKLLKSKKYDAATKKRYIRKIVGKIVNEKYEEDSTTSSEFFVPKKSPKQVSKFTVDTFKDEFLPKEQQILPKKGDFTKCEIASSSSNSQPNVSSESSKSWKDDKTLSEKLHEEKHRGQGDHLVNFAKKEHQNQIDWIKDEISHLTKLKGLLENKIQRTTTVYMLHNYKKCEDSCPNSESQRSSGRNYVIQTEFSSSSASDVPQEYHLNDRNYQITQLAAKPENTNIAKKVVGDIEVVSDERTTNIKVKTKRVDSGEDFYSNLPDKYGTYPRSREEDKCWPCGRFKSKGAGSSAGLEEEERCWPCGRLKPSVEGGRRGVAEEERCWPCGRIKPSIMGANVVNQCSFDVPVCSHSSLVNKIKEVVGKYATNSSIDKFATQICRRKCIEVLNNRLEALRDINSKTSNLDLQAESPEEVCRRCCHKRTNASGVQASYDLKEREIQAGETTKGETVKVQTSPCNCLNKESQTEYVSESDSSESLSGEGDSYDKKIQTIADKDVQCECREGDEVLPECECAKTRNQEVQSKEDEKSQVTYNSHETQVQATTNAETQPCECVCLTIGVQTAETRREQGVEPQVSHINSYERQVQTGAIKKDGSVQHCDCVCLHRQVQTDVEKKDQFMQGDLGSYESHAKTAEGRMKSKMLGSQQVDDYRATRPGTAQGLIEKRRSVDSATQSVQSSRKTTSASYTGEAQAIRRGSRISESEVQTGAINLEQFDERVRPSRTGADSDKVRSSMMREERITSTFSQDPSTHSYKQVRPTLGRADERFVGPATDLNQQVRPSVGRTEDQFSDLYKEVRPSTGQAYDRFVDPSTDPYKQVRPSVARADQRFIDPRNDPKRQVRPSTAQANDRFVDPSTDPYNQARASAGRADQYVDSKHQSIDRDSTSFAKPGQTGKKADERAPSIASGSLRQSQIAGSIKSQDRGSYQVQPDTGTFERPQTGRADGRFVDQQVRPSVGRPQEQVADSYKQARPSTSRADERFVDPNEQVRPSIARADDRFIGPSTDPYQQVRPSVARADARLVDPSSDYKQVRPSIREDQSASKEVRPSTSRLDDRFGGPSTFKQMKSGAAPEDDRDLRAIPTSQSDGAAKYQASNYTTYVEQMKGTTPEGCPVTCRCFVRIRHGTRDDDLKEQTEYRDKYQEQVQTGASRIHRGSTSSVTRQIQTDTKGEVRTKPQMQTSSSFSRQVQAGSKGIDGSKAPMGRSSSYTRQVQTDSARTGDPNIYKEQAQASPDLTTGFIKPLAGDPEVFTKHKSMDRDSSSFIKPGQTGTKVDERAPSIASGSLRQSQVGSTKSQDRGSYQVQPGTGTFDRPQPAGSYRESVLDEASAGTFGKSEPGAVTQRIRDEASVSSSGGARDDRFIRPGPESQRGKVEPDRISSEVYTSTKDEQEVAVTQTCDCVCLAKQVQTRDGEFAGTQTCDCICTTKNIQTSSISNQESTRTHSDEDLEESLSSSSDSITEITESIKSCLCCKQKNVKSKRLYALREELSTQAYPICNTCCPQTHNLKPANYYNNPGHVCNCYTVVQTKTLERIKDTIKDLKELEQFCTCVNDSVGTSNCCKYCKNKLKHTSKNRNGIAYMLTFENDPQLQDKKKKKEKKRQYLEEIKIKIPVPVKKKHKDKENIRKKSKQSHDSEGTSCGSPPKNRRSFDLQEYLNANRPEFVQEAEGRRQTVNESRKHREDFSDINKLMFLQKCQEECSKNIKKLFSNREMKEITERNYKRLPEVQQKLLDNRDRQLRRASRLMADTFNRKLRENVLKGKRNLPTDVKVINM